MTDLPHQRGESWTFVPAEAPGEHAGFTPPPPPSIRVAIGDRNRPFLSTTLSGHVLRWRVRPDGAQVYEVRLAGRRGRLTVTGGDAKLRIGGRGIDRFPRKRSRRMAGK